MWVRSARILNVSGRIPDVSAGVEAGVNEAWLEASQNCRENAVSRSGETAKGALKEGAWFQLPCLYMRKNAFFVKAGDSAFNAGYLRSHNPSTCRSVCRWWPPLLQSHQTPQNISWDLNLWCGKEDRRQRSWCRSCPSAWCASLVQITNNNVGEKSNSAMSPYQWILWMKRAKLAPEPYQKKQNKKSTKMKPGGRWFFRHFRGESGADFPRATIRCFQLFLVSLLSN